MNEIGDAGLALQLEQQVQDPLGDQRVERRGHLVADDEVGLGGERPGDADALLLAAGELARQAARRTLAARPTWVSSSLDARRWRLPFSAAGIECERPADDLARRAGAGSAPRPASGGPSGGGAACSRWRPSRRGGSGSPAKLRRPSIGRQQAGDDARQRALAGAGFADDRDRAAARDVEVDVLEHAQRPAAVGRGRRRGPASSGGVLGLDRLRLLAARGDQRVGVGLARRVQDLRRGARSRPSCRGAAP